MKAFRIAAALTATLSIALLCACSSTDSEGMPPFTGKGGAGSGLGGKGGPGGIGSGSDIAGGGAGLDGKGGPGGDISIDGAGGLGGIGGKGGLGGGKDGFNTGGAGKDGASLSQGARGGNWTPDESKKFTPVYFAFDQYRIGASETAKLEVVCEYMKTNANCGVIIEGNCDERGSGEYNMGLGERRALAVRDYLVQLGVSGDRFQTVSYGSERPAVQGHDEQAWAKNRRCEMIPATMQ